MQTNICIFDKPYSSDLIAEGCAIQWAVINGSCNVCQYLKECKNNRDFVFPEKAACMKKKAEFIRKEE